MSAICLRASGDTPTLYFYGELDAASRDAFEQHLASCGACAATVAELEQVRAALADRAAVSRADREWDDFMARLERHVRASDAPSSLRRGLSVSKAERARVVTPWLVLAATLVLGIALGLFWQQRSLGPRHTQVGDAAASGAALDAAAARHFERAQLVVLGLAMKDAARASAADWEYERGLAAALLPETRLFRLSAADRGDARLARLLGDLEAVLLQAAMASDADPPELQRLQRIIRGRDLIVRMRLREL